MTRHAHSPGELLLDVIAARILTAVAPFSQRHPGQLAAANGDLRAFAGDGPGHIVAALHAAGALPPDSPVPGQLAGLCARLGITGHGITAPPAADLPERWQSMLTRRRGLQAPAAPGILAATVAELPELDGAKIAIAGLHHGEHGTIMHLLATGVTLEGDWPYARGVRPLPVLWVRDSDGRWHATRLDSLSPWGDNGANPWTDTRMVTAWLQITPAGSAHRLDRDIRNRAIGPGPGHTVAQPAVTIRPATDTGFLLPRAGPMTYTAPTGRTRWQRADSRVTDISPRTRAE